VPKKCRKKLTFVTVIQKNCRLSFPDMGVLIKSASKYWRIVYLITLSQLRKHSFSTTCHLLQLLKNAADIHTHKRVDLTIHITMTSCALQQWSKIMWLNSKTLHNTTATNIKIILWGIDMS